MYLPRLGMGDAADGIDVSGVIVSNETTAPAGTMDAAFNALPLESVGFQNAVQGIEQAQAANLTPVWTFSDLMPYLLGAGGLLLGLVLMRGRR